MTVELLNVDCMDYMCGLENNAFDLAIVDPPYGHGNNSIKTGNTKSNIANSGKLKAYNNDKPPSRSYFKELKRVSKNQIIWGANHFAGAFHSSSSAWLVWDKQTTGSYADCELAYSSFGTVCKRFNYVWNGMHQGCFGGNTKLNVKRIHPTQKPVPLYDWLLKNYAKPGQRILDTHLGSGSSAIAAHYYGVDFVGCELDEDYYNSAKKRFVIETSQISLF